MVDDRDTLKDTLRDGQPDIIYLYCHAFARNQFADGTISGPNLGFGDGDGRERAHRRPQPHRRGVETRPAGLPQRLQHGSASIPARRGDRGAVRRHRHAGALIGTEVTVWEILAAEMAETFLDSFLRNATAGDALRRARRLLLLNNPLGLVYTLYGKAELTL